MRGFFRRPSGSSSTSKLPFEAAESKQSFSDKTVAKKKEEKEEREAREEEVKEIKEEQSVAATPEPSSQISQSLLALVH